MDQLTTVKRTRQNWLLMGAAVLFVALAVVLCIILRPKTQNANAFRIRYGNGQTVTYPANGSVRIIIRNGVLCDEATGEGEENIIHIETATCPHRECMEQGRLDAETIQTRPLGPWIICAPHGVSIEYVGDGT